MYKLVRQKRKSITIEVNADYQVIVKAPLSISEARIEELLLQKREWIEAAIERKRSVQESIDWVKNGQILYLGLYRKIIIIENLERKNKIEYNEGIFYIYTVDANKENLHKMMYVWMKEKAYLLCQERSDYYAKAIGCSYKKITIRNQKTRWGSCSSNKTLSYNVRIMGAPKDKIEYIILHEVMHLKHFNHGQLFWKEIQQIMPDYKEKEAYFKRQGAFLQI